MLLSVVFLARDRATDIVAEKEAHREQEMAAREAGESATVRTRHIMDRDPQFIPQTASIRDAIALAHHDPLVRLVASIRANSLLIFAGGRGQALASAAEAYRAFLLELAKGKADDALLLDILDEADIRLNMAYEKSEPVRQ